MVFLCGSIVVKKKERIASITFFNGFATTKWRPAPFLWFCYEEGDNSNVVTFLYGDGVVEKAMVGGDFFFFGWCFWFSSLELKINNETVVLFSVEGWNC
jgi:hypothetical protein